MNNNKQSTIKGQTLLRQRNVLLVLNTINSSGPISKREIVYLTGLSFAKVNSIIIFLNNLNLILEVGKEKSSGGRPSSIFEFNSNFRYTIGCQLSHTQIHTIVSNLKGEILFNDIKPFDKSTGKEFVIDLMIDSIDNLINLSGIPHDKFIGIGVAIAGLFNPKDETTLPFPHLVSWGNVSFKSILYNKFKLPCYVNNIANAAALAERNYGLGKGIENVLYLNIGSGLGMGIIFNGKLYEGVSGTAGEFGHITVDENGPICACGNVGCLEAIASTKAVINDAKDRLKQGVLSVLSNMVKDNINDLDFKMICAAAIQSDKLAFSVIDKMGQNLGEGIVTLINLLNPERIILGGKIVDAKNLIIIPIMNIVQKRALEIPRRNTEIVFSNMGSNAGTVGSTIPIIERFFENEVNKLIE
ncbi:MAG: ROK family protein [Bacteroidetes bacterium]|nr:ROK family protein [Bacteroidota bacterium]MBU1116509.1 ROK family protein [Bacteroidota bacterium]MBU1798766.1 ROK family protein [Bacteroidota bacterium]